MSNLQDPERGAPLRKRPTNEFRNFLFGRPAGSPNQRKVTHCCGCGRIFDAPWGLFCGGCAIYAGRGKRVEGSGGSWVEGAAGYMGRSENSTVTVSAFVRQSPYTIGTSDPNRKPESILFGKDRFLKRPAFEWLRLDAPLVPRCDAHFSLIDWMARDQHGRAMLSPWQLERYQARTAA